MGARDSMLGYQLVSFVDWRLNFTGSGIITPYNHSFCGVPIAYVNNVWRTNMLSELLCVHNFSKQNCAHLLVARYLIQESR